MAISYLLTDDGTDGVDNMLGRQIITGGDFGLANRVRHAPGLPLDGRIHYEAVRLLQNESHYRCSRDRERSIQEADCLQRLQWRRQTGV